MFKKFKTIKHLYDDIGLCYSHPLWILFKGLIKRFIFYRFLQWVYKFDQWHVNYPFELKPYAMFVVKYINENLKPNVVVEIGCGLGEILANIQAKEKYGIDIDKKVLNAASFLHKNKGIKFKEGSFEVVENLNIDVLIALNFLHGVNRETVKNMLEKIFQQNKIKYIIVDNYEEGNYNHNWEIVFKDFPLQLVYKGLPDQYYNKSHSILVFKNIICAG